MKPEELSRGAKLWGMNLTDLILSTEPEMVLKSNNRFRIGYDPRGGELLGVKVSVLISLQAKGGM